MATTELKTINSVLKNKDINVLFAPHVDDLFEAYKDVWESIKGYHHKYHAIPDLEVIQERFPDVENVEVNGQTAYYLDVLKKEYLRNKLEAITITLSKDLTSDSAPRLKEQVQNALSKLDRFTNSAKDLDVMDVELAERHYEEVAQRAQVMGGVPGISTGVSFIDSAYTTGFSPGDLIVVLGWTGRAKSLFSTLVCCNAHDRGFKPMICSLEMSGDKLRDRIWTLKGSGLFSNTSLSLGNITTDDITTFKKAQEGKQEFIVISGDGVTDLTPNVMQAKIDQYKPDVLVLDYAQLATDNARSPDMTARMRNMSSEYKRLAEANEIPVILISSATPDSATAVDGPPLIEQVAWSKQLCYDADLGFAVHKYDDSNLVKIVCRKNRNGPLFSGYLDWDIDRGLFQEKFESEIP